MYYIYILYNCSFIEVAYIAKVSIESSWLVDNCPVKRPPLEYSVCNILFSYAEENPITSSFSLALRITAARLVKQNLHFSPKSVARPSEPAINY